MQQPTEQPRLSFHNAPTSSPVQFNINLNVGQINIMNTDGAHQFRLPTPKFQQEQKIQNYLSLQPNQRQ